MRCESAETPPSFLLSRTGASPVSLAGWNTLQEREVITVQTSRLSDSACNDLAEDFRGRGAVVVEVFEVGRVGGGVGAEGARRGRGGSCCNSAPRRAP